MKLKLNLSKISTKSDLHDYSTRHNYQLLVSNFGINKSKNWLDVVMIIKLPPETHSISNMIFETTLRSWLISDPFDKLREFFNAHFLIKFLLFLFFWFILM